MSLSEERYEAIGPRDEGVNDMLDVNPRTLPRVVVDTLCLREVTRAEMSARLVRCAPSVFTEARHSWCNVELFGGWFEIMPMIELDLPEHLRTRFGVVGPGWIKDLVTCVHRDRPELARTATVAISAIALITDRREPIALRNEWCSGCN